MLKKSLLFISFLLVLVHLSCAKRGSITGGLKDTIPPTLRYSTPENYSTNFKGNQFVLTFDEYIKMKNLNKQLIVSPPMKNPPLITPTNVSKVITVKILDTLLPNTTYNFNFGQSITDNNEGNPYNQLKYIFSTGSYIDSLTLGGRIKDAYNKTPDNFVSVMLYEINEQFNDSVIYKENPRYITNTLDSLSTFKFENLKEGKYLLMALKDKGENNKFNPKDDKIGFIKQYINVPNDTLFEIDLFKETLPTKVLKPIVASGNRLLLPYEGKQDYRFDRPKVVLTNNNEIIETIVNQHPKKDSLNIWFKPTKADSLQVAINKDDYEKKFTIRFKDQKKDTLNISALQNGIIHFRDRFTLESTTPLTAFKENNISVFDKDSSAVNFKLEYNDFEQKLHIDFDKEPEQKYSVNLLPGAVTDFFEKSNDSLSYKLTTNKTENYGNLVLTLKNAKRFPLIIELTNKKGDVVLASAYTEGETTLDFKLLQPENFSIRAIYDDNKNKKYDAGSYLEKRYAEEVNYLQKDVDVRANWDVEQVFDLSIQYNPEIDRLEEQKKKKETSKKKSTF